jgi:hypothetical protein
MAYQTVTPQLSSSVPQQSALEPGHFYYWTVQACNPTVCGGQAPWWGFTTSTGLGVPDMLAPAANATGVGVTPTFRWSAASGANGATQYILSVWDPAAGALTIERTVAGLSYAVPASAALQAGQVYYWMVQACNPTVCGSQSTWQGFTT